ncbi:hypothetical protein [Rugamonas rivuli]|uniref:Uncharacterized protein n=1 Tax=Rugamonas rivuli TaxID=2743358 RepID=A0A843SK43_9BURK|nr:hypothetical protein [Rugamonas rivuli]MQA23642.1 hypothetical protein [Rugamonas rivuli]
MKKAKAPRVPVLESAFEINLPKLLRAAKATGSSVLVLDDGDERTVVALSETRLAVHLGGRMWLADIVAVPCLNNRVRPLLKCPRAHEGNFQSLYYRAGELACRHCHALRYRSNLAATPAARIKFSRTKQLVKMGHSASTMNPSRPIGRWRKSYIQELLRLAGLTAGYKDVIARRA